MTLFLFQRIRWFHIQIMNFPKYLRRFVTLIIAILTIKYPAATLRLLILVRALDFCWTLSIQDEKLRCASHYVAYLRTAEKDPHAIKTFDRRLPFEVEELAFAAGTEAAIQTRWAIHGWKKITNFMSPTIWYDQAIHVVCLKPQSFRNSLLFVGTFLRWGL